MIEPYANNVSIESPPSPHVPEGVFSRTAIPSCLADPPMQRQIFLRPEDTVIFEDEQCFIKVSVVKSEPTSATGISQGNRSAAATDIQVKSSAQQSLTIRDGAEPEPLVDDEDTEDGDVLDQTAFAPDPNRDATPATSRPTEGLAVKDTPSRPAGRDSGPMYSTAPNNRLSEGPNIKNSNGVDASTPSARAGAEKAKRAQVKISDDGDSQFVFPNAKGQKTYGGTPRQKRVGSKREILESPTKEDGSSEDMNDDSVVDGAASQSPRPSTIHRAGESQSSPNRKRSIDESVKDAGNISSTAPPTKRKRGRPSNASKKLEAVQKKNQLVSTQTPTLTKSGKQRVRRTKTYTDDDTVALAEPPSSSGKLKMPHGKRDSRAEKRLEADDDDDDDDDDEEGDTGIVVLSRTSNVSPDLDPRPNSTPQSSGAPMGGKTPARVLLSGLKPPDVNKATNWLKKQRISVEDVVPGKRSNFVCVVSSGELPTTAKVVRSLARGKKVVTDQWIKDSISQGELVDLDPYVHDDLADTVDVNRSKLFEGKSLFITHALMVKYGHGFADIKELATDVGALRVETGATKKATGMSAFSTIILGADGDDPGALKLTQEDGRIVYQKDLLTQSIIRGALLCDDDEFHWKPSTTGTGKKGKK